TDHRTDDTHVCLAPGRLTSGIYSGMLLSILAMRPRTLDRNSSALSSGWEQCIFRFCLTFADTGSPIATYVVPAPNNFLPKGHNAGELWLTQGTIRRLWSLAKRKNPLLKGCNLPLRLRVPSGNTTVAMLYFSPMA